MQKILILSIFLFLTLFFHQRASAQCEEFAQSECKSELGTYLHDGNYNATVLTQGQHIELVKTFYAGLNHRIVVCGANDLPDVLFEVLDADRNVIFSNKDEDYTMIWDFTVETSQQLIVSVTIPISQDEKFAKNGCIAILLGFSKDTDN